MNTILCILIRDLKTCMIYMTAADREKWKQVLLFVLSVGTQREITMYPGRQEYIFTFI